MLRKDVRKIFLGVAHIVPCVITYINR